MISKGDNVRVIRKDHNRYGQTGIVRDTAPRVPYARVAFGTNINDVFSIEFKDLEVLEDDF